MSRSRVVDYWARGENGKYYDEKYFNLKIFWPNIKQVTKNYNIEYNPDNIIPQAEQNELLDRIFLAGKEMLLQTGIYNISTGRIINFEEWEIDETLAKIPDKISLGEGDDRIEVKYRGLDSKEVPPVLGRVLGPQSPEIIEKVFESFAKEPMIDIFHFQGVIEKVYGVPARPNSPFEMIQEVIRTEYAKNVLKRVGRAGAYDGGSVPVSVQAMMLGFEPGWGKKSTDGAHCYIMPPMKVDYDQLCRVYFYHLRNISFWTTASVFLGGMEGPPQTAAVTLVATAIAEQLLYKPTIQQFSANLMDYTCKTARAPMWTSFNAAAAFIKNTHCACVRSQPGGIITAGLGQDHFWEVGACALASTVLNCLVSAGTGRQSGARDCAAGISARFAGEVAHAGAAMDKNTANELVKKFISKYESKIENKTLHKMGKDFRDCYDLEKVVPNKEILEELKIVKNEMKELGFEIP